MKKLILLLSMFFMLYGCKEPIWNNPPTDGETPSPVRNYSVKNLVGKSIIKFEVPDVYTLYVEAEYFLADGTKKNTKASKFIDSLVVEGFSQAQEYEVVLYAVGINEKKSQPTKVKISPTKPTYLLAFESLKSSPTFGGITVQAENREREAIVIETLRKEQDGTWKSIDRYYTSTDIIKYNIRGMKDSLQEFAFFVRDRWLNYSDTIMANHKPLKEIQIPPAEITEISAAVLPGSALIHNNSTTYNAKKAVDGNMGNYYLTARGQGVPQHFNLDLKKPYSLSRLIFYQRSGYFYQGISPRKIAVWGSNSPASDGSYDGWVKLGEFEVVKPSGLPMGTNSEEDNTAANDGHNLEFDGATSAMRYLRIQTIETWALSDYLTLREFSIYGNTIN